ncbi:hypothetical protein [Lysinibacillus xylanilyticus]
MFYVTKVKRQLQVFYVTKVKRQLQVFWCESEVTGTVVTPL